MTKLDDDPKIDIIAHALVHKGICLWHGVPEHIVEELKVHGYTIKRDDNFFNRDLNNE